MAQHTVALWWPWYTRMASPVDIVHSLAVVSEDAATEKENRHFIWLTLMVVGKPGRGKVQFVPVIR